MKFYIQTLGLQKFRMFEHQEFSFGSGFNLLIGKNGSGKTSVLRAIRIAMSSLAATFQEEFKELRPLGLRLDTEKDSKRDYHGAPTSIKTAPTTISSSFIITDEKTEVSNQIDWVGRLNDKKSSATGKDLNDYVRRCLENKEVLPLTLFFSTGRLWNQANKVKFKSYDHRAYRGYLRALDDNIEIKNVMEWVSDLYTNGSQYPDHLVAIKTAMGICFPEWQNLGWNKEFSTVPGGELCGYENGDRLLLYSWLSDGQQNVVNIILETLYRCCKLNPTLFSNLNSTPEDRPSDDIFSLTPGILLIDELDMHLHPEWQQVIVERLKRAFPNIQLIATTHSPSIIQSCEAHEIIDLSNLESGNTQLARISPKLLSSSYVIKEWQGASHRSTTYQNDELAFMNFYELTDKARELQDSNKLEKYAAQVRIHLDSVSDPALSADMKLVLRGIPQLNRLVYADDQ